MATMNKPASDSTNWHQAVTDNWTSIENNLVDKVIANTKGDLLAATAASSPARLGVGVDGQVLTANSGASTGLNWTDINSAATIYSRSVKATASTSTNVTTMSDLDLMTLTINVTAGKKILVIFNASLSGASNSPALQIIRDGTVIKTVGPRSAANPWSSHVSMITLDSPSSGSHTYKVQWRSDSGTVTQDLQPYASSGDREFILVVLPG